MKAAAPPSETRTEELAEKRQFEKKVREVIPQFFRDHPDFREKVDNTTVLLGAMDLWEKNPEIRELWEKNPEAAAKKAVGDILVVLDDPADRHPERG